jgi:hypothetical protein
MEKQKFYACKNKISRDEKLVGGGIYLARTETFDLEL